MHLTERFKDSTSGNNGCAAVYAAENAPTTYGGNDYRPGHVFQGPDIGAEKLTDVNESETGVWIPQNVTDRFVSERLTELGLTRAAQEFLLVIADVDE